MTAATDPWKPPLIWTEWSIASGSIVDHSPTLTHGLKRLGHDIEMVISITIKKVTYTHFGIYLLWIYALDACVVIN